MFKGWLLTKGDAGTEAAFTDIDPADLPEGDVTVAVSHSTINYKEGLAFTGHPGVMRKSPMVPGIDYCGRVTDSASDAFNVGDEVILNGWGVGEVHWGGLAEVAKAKSEWLIQKPKELTAAQTMAIGTAGYTAMLSVMALEERGVTPASGPILVTGAAGGVGSVAVALLAKAGFTVWASTGRASEADYLKHLGAAEIIDRAELSAPGKPLGKERWAGAVDAVGSHTLANVLAQTMYSGTVTTCGLAQGPDLPATVMPFILRGVALIGIDSVMCPIEKRKAAWARLATDLDQGLLAEMTTTVPLSEAKQVASDILEGKVRGRVVVEV